MKKTFKIFTLGCKVNQYDTQAIREHYLRQNYSESAGEEPADIYIINTCTVTGSADKKSRYYIHHAHRLNPHADIIVTGCFASANKTEVEHLPGVTAVQNFCSTWEKGISSFAGHTRAFLKIQDGCDNFCSYCKVPLVRGKPTSKQFSAIVSEAKALVDNGFNEIVLCGICLGTYGKDLPGNRDLVDVIAAMEQLLGLQRIRLSSIEAWYVSKKLLEKMSGSSKLCPHLHIPLQSGDDAILKSMNRSIRQADYLDLIKTSKHMVPDVAISTDVLVGFPGETEKQFENTLAVIREISPMRTHIFPFSPRPGTKAFTAPKRISPTIITNRIKILKKLAQESALFYKKRFLHKTLPVLFESYCTTTTAWEGYTPNYLKVRIASPHKLLNTIGMIELTELNADVFTGSVIS